MMTRGDERTQAEANLVSRDEDGKRRHPRGCTVIMLILCAERATPLMASADGQTIPLEAPWTPTPPARSAVEANQLASLLVDSGMISPHAPTHLPQPQASSPSQHSRARGQTWDEIGRNPVRTMGGD